MHQPKIVAGKSIMGTNYYYHLEPKNLCKYCGRHDKQKIIHIGKSSAGWTFTFHGTNKIKSYKDWLLLFMTQPGEIFDEYGEEISKENFVKKVESKINAKFNHTTYCRNNPPDQEYAKNNCWLDPEGHSFSFGKFS